MRLPVIHEPRRLAELSLARFRCTTRSCSCAFFRSSASTVLCISCVLTVFIRYALHELDCLIVGYDAQLPLTAIGPDGLANLDVFERVLVGANLPCHSSVSVTLSTHRIRHASAIFRMALLVASIV